MNALSVNSLICIINIVVVLIIRIVVVIVIRTGVISIIVRVVVVVALNGRVVRSGCSDRYTCCWWIQLSPIRVREPLFVANRILILN